jgi:hypothetical protein
VTRLKTLTAEYLELAERLRQGGGAERVKKMHAKGQLSPRERVEKLLDPGSPWYEIGLLVAYDRYDGQAPGAGVITGVGVVEGREVVVVANDATVKAGSWWPETIPKMLRAQEVAMRQHIPIIYLVDSAGVKPAVPVRRLPRSVRRGAPLLLQQHHAALPPRAADRGRDGELRRRAALTSGALQRDLHGGGDQLHGARRTKPREGCDGPDRSTPKRWAGRRPTPNSRPSRTTARRTTWNA